MTALQLSQITPHVYWLEPDDTTDRPALGFIAGTRDALVVDTGNSPTHAQMLLDRLTRHALPRPTYAVLTHWHWDHVFGTAMFPVPTFASTETARIVTRMARLDWSDAALDQRVAEGIEIAFCRDMLKAELPDRSHLTLRPPEVGFTDQVTLDLGDVTCELVHVGGDHSPDSSIVYVRDERVVFLGDCLYPDLHHGPERLTTPRFFPLLNRLRAYDAAYYLNGHAPVVLAQAAFHTEAARWTTIGQTVDRYGQNRAAVLAALTAMPGVALTEDEVALADAFIAGLRLPEVEAVL